MHLEDAHLDETDQSRQVLDVRIGANSALFLDLDPFDAVGSLGPHVLLVEACGSLSGRTAHEAQRTFHDVRQDPVPYFIVEG